MARIRRGDLVEYTDSWYQHYPPKDDSVIKFGVCVEDFDATNNVRSTPKVERADGTIETAMHVHSYAWAGWMPDDLVETYIRLNDGNTDGLLDGPGDWSDY